MTHRFDHLLTQFQHPFFSTTQQHQISIIGLISIPGMMTGQLIAGASVMNAVKSQIIIMYLISGAAAFGTLSSIMVSDSPLMIISFFYAVCVLSR